MTSTIIVGSSTFALELAKNLKGKDTQVIMLIEDKDRALELSTEDNLIVVQGSPVDPKTLDELELQDCEVFIAATDVEETNILSGLYAKHAGVEKIFAKTTRQETEKILRKLSIIPVNPEADAASTVMLRVLEPYVSDLVSIGGRYRIVQREASQYPFLAGQTISQVSGQFFGTVAVYQDNEYFFLPSSEIKHEAVLIIVLEEGKEKELTKALKDKKKELAKVK